MAWKCAGNACNRLGACRPNSSSFKAKRCISNVLPPFRKRRMIEQYICRWLWRVYRLLKHVWLGRPTIRPILGIVDSVTTFMSILENPKNFNKVLFSIIALRTLRKNLVMLLTCWLNTIFWLVGWPAAESLQRPLMVAWKGEQRDANRLRSGLYRKLLLTCAAAALFSRAEQIGFFFPWISCIGPW